MSTVNLRLSSDDILAEYVELDQFQGWLQQRLAIGPDTFAMLLRDGEIAGKSAGGHYAVGGLWQSVKDALGGRHAIRLLIADFKPFQLQLAAQTVTQNDVQVTCEFTLEFQVNPEKPEGVLGMMSTATAIPKSDVLKRVNSALLERVLNSAVRQEAALDLRGNTGLQDKIQADAAAEVKRIAEDVGLQLRSVTVLWVDNPEEAAVVLRRQRERDDEAQEHEYRLTIRHYERQAQSTTFKLNSELAVEKTRAANDFELRDLLLSNEIKVIDARDVTTQAREERALLHTLQLGRLQRVEELKSKLESEQNEYERGRLRIEIKHLESPIIDKDTDRALRVANDRHRRRMEIARYSIITAAGAAIVFLLAWYLTQAAHVADSKGPKAAPAVSDATPPAPQIMVAPPPAEPTQPLDARPGAADGSPSAVSHALPPPQATATTTARAPGQTTPTTSGPAFPNAAPLRTSAPRPAVLNTAAVLEGRPLVLVMNADGSVQTMLTTAVAKVFAANGGAFLSTFLRGGFSVAHAGDSTDLQSVPGIERVPLILLAVSQTSSDANPFEGLRRAHVTLDVRIFRPSGGFTTDAIHLSEVGAGFSDDDALTRAAERAAEGLKRAVGN